MREIIFCHVSFVLSLSFYGIKYIDLASTDFDAVLTILSCPLRSM